MSARASTFLAIATMLCVVLIAEHNVPRAVAQPARVSARPPAAAALVSIEPATALAEIRAAYSTAPTCDRVTISLKLPDRPGKTESVIVARLWQAPKAPRQPADATKDTPAPDGDANARGSGGASSVERVLSLELGPLRAIARDGQLRVIHTQHESTVYIRSYEKPLNGASLRRLMPPVGLVALAILASADELPDDPPASARGMTLTPWATGVRFTSATLDPKAERPELLLRGTCDQGEVSLTADGATGRLTRMTTTFKTQLVLEMTFEPQPAGDPATWVIDTTKRRPVDTLADLTIAEASLRVGNALSFLDATQVFGDGQDAAKSAIVMLVSDPNPAQPAPSSTEPIAAAGVSAIAGLVDLVDAAPVRARAFIATRRRPEGDDEIAMRAALPVRWASIATSGVLNPPATTTPSGHEPVLPAPAPVATPASVALIGPARSTIQRLSPEAQVVLCVVDRAMKIHAVIEVDGRVDDVAAMTRELREAGRRAGVPTGEPGQSPPEQPAPTAPERK